MPRGRVFLSGFGAFPGVPDNPSARIVTAARGVVVDGNATAVLPVTYGAITRWVATMDFSTVDRVLQLGVASTAATYRLEGAAYNDDGGHPDAEGARWPTGSPLVAGAPERLTTTVDVVSLCARVAAIGPTPLVVSNDPGRYLCNALYFMTLAEVRRRRLAPRSSFSTYPEP